ncbi:MAG: class IIb bacteriocin, lactobin A/cerein 7B family [Turicibacter sp.]|nr:class IIb bacteriocin, lactobin A/cerein 7B family [Turicibacter sp.]
MKKGNNVISLESLNSLGEEELLQVSGGSLTAAGIVFGIWLGAVTGGILIGSTARQVYNNW